MPTKKTLEGTSVSGAHIGGKASKRLAATVKDDDLTMCIPVATASAEVANGIGVAVQLTDADGADLASSRRLFCQVFDADMEPGIETELTMVATTGTELSTTGKSGLLVTTTAAGVVDLIVIDVTTALAATVYLKITPVDGLGVPAMVPLTFA